MEKQTPSAQFFLLFRSIIQIFLLNNFQSFVSKSSWFFVYKIISSVFSRLLSLIFSHFLHSLYIQTYTYNLHVSLLSTLIIHSYYLQFSRCFSSYQLHNHIIVSCFFHFVSPCLFHFFLNFFLVWKLGFISRTQLFTCTILIILCCGFLFFVY